MFAIIVIRYTGEEIQVMVVGPNPTITSFLELLFVTNNTPFTHEDKKSNDGHDIAVVREYYVRYTNEFQLERIIKKVRDTFSHVNVFDQTTPEKNEKILITDLNKLSW